MSFLHLQNITVILQLQGNPLEGQPPVDKSACNLIQSSIDLLLFQFLYSLAGIPVSRYALGIDHNTLVGLYMIWNFYR